MSGSVRRFAGFVYSAQTGLTRDGVPIHLGPQARRLLELLLEAEGRVVTKAEIAARLWPDRPPSDDSIDRCAYLLRKPLRDAGFGDLIATAYGRGLSLRARVEALRSETMAAPRTEPALTAHVLELWRTAYELAATRTRDGFERAQSAIAAAAERAPASPAVWTLSADLAATRVLRGYLTPAQAAATIEEDAGRALALLPDFAAALAALGWARAMLSGRVADGLALLDRAVDRDPHYGRAHAYRGWALLELGRLDDALAETEAGLRCAPLDQSLLSLNAWLGLCAGGAARGVELARRGLELRPDSSGLRAVGAVAASLCGRHQEALELAYQKAKSMPGDPMMLATLAYVLARAGLVVEAEEALAAATGPEQVAAPCLFVAAAALAVGRPEKAIALLECGEAEHCPWSCFAPHDPRLAPIAEDVARIRAPGPETRPGG